MKAGTTGPAQVLVGATGVRYLGIESRDHRKEITSYIGFRVRMAQRTVCLALSLRVEGRSGDF